MTYSRNFKLWLLIAFGIYTLYELVTLKPEQKEFDESEIYND